MYIVQDVKINHNKREIVSPKSLYHKLYFLLANLIFPSYGNDGWNPLPFEIRVFATFLPTLNKIKPK